MDIKDRIKKITKDTGGNCFALYSILFVILSLFVFSWIYLNGRTFIDGGDSLTQHYKAFTYYATYLRKIASTLIHEHRLVMPRWHFGLGEGGDIIGTLHYYCIGDPLALLGVFCPTSKMYIAYALVQVIRLYISGLIFIFLCRETMGKPSVTAVTAGALLYAFSSFSMAFFCGHTFFLNALQYLPLVILGIEKVLKQKKPYVLIIGVMLAALSNFYFFYMIGIMAACYCILRLVLLYSKDIKQLFMMLLKLVASAFLGMLMSGVILLPQLYVFLGNPKNGLDFKIPYLFDLAHYLELPGTLVSATSFGTIGFVLPALIGLFMVKKRYLTVKICAVTTFIFLLLPIFGSIFNGFSHSLDRWIFMAVLINAYIVTLMWDELFIMDGKKLWFIFVVCLIYFAAIMLLEGADTKNSLTGMAEAFILLFICAGPSGDNRKRYKSFTLAITAVCIYFSWYFGFSPNEAGRGTLKIDSLQKKDIDAVDVVKDVAAKEGYDGFYRVTNIGDINNGLLTGLSSTAFYWSTLNPYEDEFMQTLGMRNNDSVAPFDYDERAVATDIASIRYYGAGYEDDMPNVPYGFSLVGNVDYSEQRRSEKLEELKAELGVQELTDAQAGEINDIIDSRGSIYENDHFLPLGFAYDKYYSLEDALKLNLAEREDVMLDAAVLALEPGQTPSVSAAKYDSRVVSLPYTLEYDENKMYIDGSRYLTTSGGTELTMHIDADTSGMELMIGMDGLEFEAVTDYQRYLKEDELYDPHGLYSRTAFDLKSDGEKREILKQRYAEKERKTSFSIVDEYGRKKGFNYFSPYNKKYSGKHEFLVNLGYGDIGVKTVVITFAQAGIYHIDDLLVYGHLMSDYADRSSKLKENVLEDEYVGVDEISGRVSFDEGKLLYLSLPYSKGWEAFVDGNAAKLIRANYMYSAIDVPAGEHEIYLKYHTPYLMAGTIVSILGFIVFIGLIVIDKKVKRKTGEKKNESA